MATMYAHELAEVVTDYMGAWYFDDSVDLMENGDACVWEFGTLNNGNSNVVIGEKNFLIQKMWVPEYGCKLSL